jgi:hypothetical protein
MAKKVWVYTLENTNINPPVEDFNGTKANHPMLHHIYVADDNHPQLADDGSKPLFHSASGIIDPYEIDEIMANPPATQPPATLTGITVTGNPIGAEGSTSQFTVSPVPTNAVLPTVTYASSHDDIASVDNSGKISFIKGGFVTFTVTAGGFTKTLDGETTNANAATFVSAETYNGYGVKVVLSEAPYGHVHTEWEIKVGGAVVAKQHTSKDDSDATGKTLLINFNNSDYPTAPMKTGDTITVSHKTAASGTAAFTDKPVTNNL